MRGSDLQSVILQDITELLIIYLSNVDIHAVDHNVIDYILTAVIILLSNAQFYHFFTS